MQHVPANSTPTATRATSHPLVSHQSNVLVPSPEPTRPSHTLVASHRQPQEYPGPAAQWRPGSRRDTLRAPQSQQLIFLALNSCVFLLLTAPCFALNSCVFSLSTAVFFSSQQLCFLLLTAPCFRSQQLCFFAFNSCAVFAINSSVCFRSQQLCLFALNSCAFLPSKAVFSSPRRLCFFRSQQRPRAR